jgi:hypothetical protein
MDFLRYPSSSALSIASALMPYNSFITSDHLSTAGAPWFLAS